MWISEPRGDVELEVFAVLDDVIAQADVVHVVLFERQLEENRFQDGVDLFTDALQQARVAKLKQLKRSYRDQT